MNKPMWMYNEFEYSGVDYTDLKKVEEYDRRHSSFRDFRKETEERVNALHLCKDSIVIDLGCGTGAFTINAAPLCKKIHAVDVSEIMLKYIKAKAESAKLSNIEFHHGGMLSYEHKGEAADAVISSAVLHHLPDFWKQVALKRIHDMLKPGGKFFLFDVVFSFPQDEYKERFAGWVQAIGEKTGQPDEPATHLSKEYSTFSWVMEGLLERAGFKIEMKDYEESGFMAKYICRRPSE